MCLEPLELRFKIHGFLRDENLQKFIIVSRGIRLMRDKNYDENWLN